MEYYQVVCQVLKKIFLLASCSFLTAAVLYDECSLSPGLGYNKFQRYSTASVAENYRSISPQLSLMWLKNINPNWALSLEALGNYDIDLNSKNHINNGLKKFNAHAFVLDGKLTLLYQLSKKHEVRLGLGSGVGCFWLKTFINNNSAYTNYAHAYLPFGRLYKNYALTSSVHGSLMAEYSRIDSYYVQGNGYSVQNTFWLHETDTLSQGIKIDYHYWNLNLGVIKDKPWISAFQSGGLSYEIRFK
jgi:hypothetical protein